MSKVDAIEAWWRLTAHPLAKNIWENCLILVLAVCDEITAARSFGENNVDRHCGSRSKADTLTRMCQYWRVFVWHLSPCWNLGSLVAPLLCLPEDLFQSANHPNTKAREWSDPTKLTNSLTLMVGQTPRSSLASSLPIWLAIPTLIASQIPCNLLASHAYPFSWAGLPPQPTGHPPHPWLTPFSLFPPPRMTGCSRCARQQKLAADNSDCFADHSGMRAILSAWRGETFYTDQLQLLDVSFSLFHDNFTVAFDWLSVQFFPLNHLSVLKTRWQFGQYGKVCVALQLYLPELSSLNSFLPAREGFCSNWATISEIFSCFAGPSCLFFEVAFRPVVNVFPLEQGCLLKAKRPFVTFLAA